MARRGATAEQCVIQHKGPSRQMELIFDERRHRSLSGLCSPSVDPLALIEAGQDAARRRSPTILIVRCTNPSVRKKSFPRRALRAAASFVVDGQQEREGLPVEISCRIRHDVRFRTLSIHQDGRPPVERKRHWSKSTCTNMRLPVSLQSRINGHQWLRKLCASLRSLRTELLGGAPRDGRSHPCGSTRCATIFP